jgi:hypothetical protein
MAPSALATPYICLVHTASQQAKQQIELRPTGTGELTPLVTLERSLEASVQMHRRRIGTEEEEAHMHAATKTIAMRGMGREINHFVVTCVVSDADGTGLIR